jgi:hypothetical protein
LESFISPKNTFFLVGNGIWEQDLDTSCAHCYRDVFISRPFQILVIF